MLSLVAMSPSISLLTSRHPIPVIIPQELQDLVLNLEAQWIHICPAEVSRLLCQIRHRPAILPHRADPVQLRSIPSQGRSETQYD